jgi:ferredoxin-NADP reductase
MRPPAHRARVHSYRDIAPGVREFDLELLTGPFPFTPGQWISLHLPVGEKPPLVRAYTLAAPPDPHAVLKLCLDRCPEGLGSGYLFSLEPGAELAFDGPLGRFVLPEEAGELLWIARYTGIVPFRCFLHARQSSAAQGDAPQPSSIHLLYSAAGPTDLAYRNEFETAAASCPWFSVEFLLDAGGPPPDHGVEQILEKLSTRAPAAGSVVPMICGVKAFVRPIREFFLERGFDRKAVLCETYD